MDARSGQGAGILSAGLRSLALLAGLVAAGNAAGGADAAASPAATARGKSPESGLPAWEILDRGARLGVAQISATQASAFYRARGFEPHAAAGYAGACVFQLVLANEGADGTLANRLSDWTIDARGTTMRFVAIESWEREWARLDVAEPARIAFRWAQFPAEQEFAPGDWIMGMAALVPRPSGSFDLNYEWSIDGVSHRGTLRGLACASED
jgi:hypothetical protein